MIGYIDKYMEKILFYIIKNIFKKIKKKVLRIYSNYYKICPRALCVS